MLHGRGLKAFQLLLTSLPFLLQQYFHWTETSLYPTVAGISTNREGAMWIGNRPRYNQRFVLIVCHFFPDATFRNRRHCPWRF